MHFLRYRPELNLLLDAEDGSRAIVPSRILDDRTERSRRRLSAAEISARVENILSTCGHETLPATIATALTEIHNRRAMVLGWRSRGRRQISRFIEKIRLRTLSKSSSARAGGAV